MQSLTLFFFLQFAALALFVPAAVGLLRGGRRKLLAALAAPTILLPLVLLMVWAGLLLPNAAAEVAWLAALRVQLLAIAFVLTLAGTTIFLGRPWPLQAPAIVTLLALAALTTPLWGNPLLGLTTSALEPLAAALPMPAEALRPFFARILAAVNPLLTVSEAMGYDWVRSPQVIYQHTRLGTDLAYTAPSWLFMSLFYALLGAAAFALSLLLRDRERPSLYLPPVED